MRTIFTTFCLIFISSAAANASAEDSAPPPHSVLQQLQRAGYQDVRDIDFDDGLWEAEVRHKGGWWREIAVHAETGEIYDAWSGRQVLGRGAATRALKNQGYTLIKDLERKGAVWKAEVRDASLNCLDVSISGYDGSVLHQKMDSDC